MGNEQEKIESEVMMAQDLDIKKITTETMHKRWNTRRQQLKTMKRLMKQ